MIPRPGRTCIRHGAVSGSGSGNLAVKRYARAETAGPGPASWTFAPGVAEEFCMETADHGNAARCGAKTDDRERSPQHGHGCTPKDKIYYGLPPRIACIMSFHAGRTGFRDTAAGDNPDKLTDPCLKSTDTQERDMATPPSEIKRLGRYDIEAVLGKGAMGIVYAGNDSRLKRKVAIKTILKSALDEDTAKEYSMRFDREARAVARLNHPNIVQVYDFGEEGDIAYIVMEFIKGRELKDFFDAKERFELKESVHIMCELCDALHFAHEAGVVHRDIKPANVMIDSSGRVKLADFGVARITDADRNASEKTQAGVVIGTPAYMSPEQLEGNEIDRRTDIFSAGVVLYQFLTGEKPFTGTGAWTIAKKILHDDPPRPSSIHPTISPLFDAVVNKALAKKVEDRYQTARDFEIALKNALEGKGEADDEKTIVGGFGPGLGAQAAAPAGGGVVDATLKMGTAAMDSTIQRQQAATAAQETDLEFWRAIKDGNDPDDFDLYVQQFPNGIYTALAKRKGAKLRGATADETISKSNQAQEQERREIEEAARREAEAKAKLAEDKAKLEAEMAKREAEFKQREADAEAKREADAKARAEAEAKSKAEFEAALAKREAEFQKRAAEIEAKREEEQKKREEADKLKAAADAKKKAEFEAEVAKREAELKKREAEGGRKITPAMIAGVVALVVAIGVGVYFIKPDSSVREAELLKMLEEAKKANSELLQAKEKEKEMQKAVELARRQEEAAKASGDVAKQRELAEQTRQREAEAQKQAELIKKREAEAHKQAELNRQRQEELKQLAEARKAAEAKKQTGAAKQAAEKAAAGKSEAERAAVEKAAADKLAAEKAAAAGKSEAERAAADKLAAEKAAATRAAAEKTAAEKAAADRLAVEKAAADKLAAEKAASDKAAADKAVAEKTKLASIDPNAQFKQGQAAESGGDLKTAVRLYTQAARAGNGEAAKLLGDIYSTGRGSVPRDYAESLRWYAIAEKHGVKVERARAR